jgi:hypothetical protein
MVGKNGPDIPIPKNQSSVDVSEGEVWLASDNRFLPYDSRDYGSVELESCKETIVFRLVSALGFFDVDKRLTFIP